MNAKRQLIVVIASLSFTSPIVLAASSSIAPSDSSTPAVKKKHHHRHQKPISIPQDKDKAMTPAAADNITQTRGLGNHAGEPNLGTGDHVPGTSGTSGQ